jgi:hypothetical protein
MKLLKKSQPKEEAAPAVSLKAKLEEAVAAAEEYIETVVEREKAEHTLISRDWIRMDLKLKHGRDSVRCALALLEKDKNG